MAGTASRPPWWLAVHLPALPLEAWLATLPAAPNPDDAAAAAGAAEPRALIQQHRILAVDALAAAAGVRPGMQRATALALAPALRLGESEPGREAAALRAVVHAALAFTPSVALGPAATVLLEAGASLRLFGGTEGLIGRLRATLAPLGHRIALAAAPTALGAAWLARWRPGADVRTDTGASLAGPAPPGTGPLPGPLPGPPTLAALRQLLRAAPVTLASAGAANAEAIAGLGVRTLGELLALPRAGLARRFGPALLEEIDRAFGQRADPQVWQQAPLRLDERVELFARAEHAAALMVGAEVLLARLLAWAAARQARVAAFELVLHHERDRHRADTAPLRLRIELAEPSVDAGHLALLLRERLQRLVLPAPVLELSLHCHELSQAPPPSGELFPDSGLDPAAQAAGLARLLERLRARLGDERVLRLEAVADHRPEHALRWHAALPTPRSPASAPPPCPNGPAPLHRPAWLIDPPEPLAERDALPCWQGRPLRLLSGPERIEAGWWDWPAVHMQGTTARAVARDYFIAEADDGSLLWVWRHRLPGAAARAGAAWFLQGRFG
jgi:protein ImuB